MLPVVLVCDLEPENAQKTKKLVRFIVQALQNILKHAINLDASRVSQLNDLVVVILRNCHVTPSIATLHNLKNNCYS